MIFLDLHPLHTSTTMRGSNFYRFLKLKGSENYESWRIDAISDLKVKGLWWIISKKLGKPVRNNSRFSKNSNKSCSHCEKMSHSKQNCWLLHSKLRSEEWKLSQKRKNLVKEEHDFEKSFEIRIVRSMKIFMICRADSHTEVWLIDIEAKNHVCYNKNLFNKQSYWKIIDNSIVTANNEAVVIVEKDSIIIDILLNDQSIKIRLIDVYHCSELHYNLMSVDQMKVKEYTCSIKNDRFRFMNSKSVVALTDSRNAEKVYFVNTSFIFSKSVILTSSSESVKTSWRQWHKRLTHLNMTDVKRLINISIDIDVNSTNSLKNEEFSESVCEVCVIDKQNRTSSRKSHIRVIKADELVHTNLVDDDKISKIDEEFRYVATMIDDYSQYTIIYLLERKFDLKDVLRKYLKLMKTRSISIHRLRSDNEDKYADHQIIELLEEHEVKWKSMTSYNSSQNEVAERCFCTLFERTRAILTSVKLLIRLWDEAIMTVIYLKNRSSITALNNITFYETWHDKKSDLSYLHMFECIVYHHVKKARRKLDDKSLKCQFLSYEKVNQFRLWNEKNVLISSYVQWNEIVIKVERYDEDLSILISFDDQIDDASFSIKITENAKIAKIVDDHQTRTSSSESDNSSDSDASDASDASSEHLKRVIVEPVDYRALNDFWARDFNRSFVSRANRALNDLWVKDHNRSFVSRANRVQIESNTSQTVKQARVSLDREQWELACRSELDAHIKNDIFVDSMNSTLDHDLAVKQIIRYLVETAQLKLRYESFKVKRVEKAEFFEYIDSVHANCLNSRRFIFDYMFFLWNESISWSFKRQQCVSTSSAEAEYVDECNAAKKLIFLIQALKEMKYDDSNTNSTTILADNQATIKMGSNLVNHLRAKHIDTSYHYVRNKVEEGAIRLKYILIDQMMTDDLIKLLKSGKFLRFRSVMKLASMNEATPVEHDVDE